MGALEKFKARSSALAARANGKSEVRQAIMSAEVVGGALIGGIMSQNVPTVMGIPSDAATGILLVGIGIGMKQRDIGAIGVGLLAGAAHEYGKTIDLGTPG